MNNNLFAVASIVIALSVGVISACSRTDTPTVSSAPVSKAPATTVGMEIDDSLITAKIKAALLEDKLIKSQDVKVETRKGDVQISGFVDTQIQIDQIAQIAKGIPGVASVANSMTVKK